MLPPDRVEFVKTLNGLAGIKPGVPGGKLSLEALDLWWNWANAKGWTLTEFKAAASHLAESVEFMPQPFHFAELRKASRPTAAEAFALARKAAKDAISCGQVRNDVTCGDPVVDAAVRGMGGYGEIALCDSGKLHFLERRFAEHYADQQDATETREALPQIASPEIRAKLASTVKRLGGQR